jgi:hypothetical protein
MYQKAIVTFLDVLGFRDLVSNSEASKVNDVLAELGRFAAPKQRSLNSADDDAPQIITFSDSVIRVRLIHTRTNRRYPVGLVFYEVLDLLHAQGELIDKGILIRGGVTYGDIYVEKNKIFGPALLTRTIWSRSKLFIPESLFRTS